MPASESRRVQVGQGLHVLRYVAAGSPERPPLARISASGTGGITFIAAPGRDSHLLTAPGSAVVLVADRPSCFDIEIVSAGRDIPLDAQLRLEALSPPEAARTNASSMRPFGRNPVEAGQHGLRLTGHVARRGDITVAAGEWLAGPASPAPIEGLSVETPNDQRRVDLEYQVLARDAHGQWSPWVHAGTYAGSRGRSLPVCGVRLRLHGAGELEGQALFLGAPVVRSRGTALDFVSPAGLDPLVGLKVAIVPSARTRRHAAEIGRVRTFRAASPQRERESA